MMAELQEFSRIIQGGRHKKSGKHFVDDGYPAYGAGGLNGYLPEPEFEHPGIVLSSIGARCGKCFLPDAREWASLANTQVIFPDPEKADIRFIWYQLNDENSWTRRGAGQPFIRPADVKTRTVYFPELSEQRRIAAILDKADAIRRKREQALDLVDEVLQSVFLEMFGDPVLNPKGWEEIPLGELLERIDSGQSPKCHNRAAEANEFGVLKVSAISSTKFRPSENKATLAGYAPPPQTLVKKGDLLFSRKNTYDLVGASAIIEEEVDGLALPDLIFRLVPSEESRLRIPYLWALLTHTGIRDRLRRLAGGAAASMPNIGKARLREMRIPVADEEFQRKFCLIFEKQRGMLSKIQSSLQETNDFFGVLSQRAFRGEL